MKTLQQIRDEAVRIRGEMQLLRNAAELWNKIRLNERPIDPELYAPLHEILAMDKLIAQCDRRLIQ